MDINKSEKEQGSIAKYTISSMFNDYQDDFDVIAQPQNAIVNTAEKSVKVIMYSSPNESYYTGEKTFLLSDGLNFRSIPIRAVSNTYMKATFGGKEYLFYRCSVDDISYTRNSEGKLKINEGLWIGDSSNPYIKQNRQRFIRITTGNYSEMIPAEYYCFKLSEPETLSIRWSQVEPANITRLYISSKNTCDVYMYGEEYHSMYAYDSSTMAHNNFYKMVKNSRDFTNISITFEDK